MAAPWRMTLKEQPAVKLASPNDRESSVSGFSLLQPVTNVQMDAESQNDLLDPDKMISPEEYVKQRLDDQIGWYDRKSGANQFWFKRLRLGEIVAAAIIPFLSGFAGGSLFIKIAIGALGVVVAVIASLLALLRFQEHWISYRATAEALKTEKFLFLTQTQPYDSADAFHLLVQRVEALLSKESAQWMQSMTKPPQGETRA
ncbi:MAG TPA: DUF4231 domain-containing protein [Candidatus Udaeobacter sp.]|jgi:hypothetical protein|nr:DUF4231 domain-containing protein [Candidatus Udaeobacter sp.]